MLHLSVHSHQQTPTLVILYQVFLSHLLHFNSNSELQQVTVVPVKLQNETRAVSCFTVTRCVRPNCHELHGGVICSGFCHVCLCVGGKVEGEMTVNGHPKNQQTFSRVCGYVEQVSTLLLRVLFHPSCEALPFLLDKAPFGMIPR